MPLQAGQAGMPNSCGVYHLCLLIYDDNPSPLLFAWSWKKYPISQSCSSITQKISTQKRWAISSDLDE